MSRFLIIAAGLVAASGLSALPTDARAPERKTRASWNNEALFDSTTTTQELLDMGRSAVAFNHASVAETYFQEVLLRDPANVEAMCELAHLYKRTGRLEYARGLLTRASTLEPMRADITANLRTVEQELRVEIRREVCGMLASGHYEQALPRIAVLLSIEPNDVEALADKTRCLAAIGQTDAALSTVDLALLKSPREDLYKLRADIATKVEHDRIASMETSARRLIDSGNWVRGEAADVLQAILAQDPSNEWAREQFRALSEGSQKETAPPPAEPMWPDTLVAAVRDVVPGVASFLDRHIAALIALIVAAILFASPLARTLARRVKLPSPFAGDIGQIDVADVLRLANASGLTGVLVFHTPHGRANVFLEDGEPSHCTGFGRSGPEALKWLVDNVEEGSFRLRPRRGPVERTIEQPLTLLLAGAPLTAAGAEAAQKRKKSRMSELLEIHRD